MLFRSEGHSSLLGLALLERDGAADAGAATDGELPLARPRCVFTTHTPVPAGHDQFPVDLARQVLEAVAHAHEHRIIHCDIKPENFILFPGNRLRLTDFGISRLAARTVLASGSGTVGYVAPEQAMGRASFQSDVLDRKSTRLNSSHMSESRMPSSA